MNYYNLLDIDKNASQIEIKKAYFSKVKKYNPENDPQMFKKIRDAYDTLRSDDLRIAYDKTLLLSDDEMIEEAKKLIELGNVKKAITLLKKIVGKYPESNELNVVLADVYEKSNSNGNASKIYKALVEKNPENPEYSMALVKSYSNLGHNMKADAQFKATVKINPLNPKIWVDWIYLNANTSFGNYGLKSVISEAESFSEDIFANNYDVYAFVWIKQSRSLFHFVSNYDYEIESCDLLNKFIKFYEKDKLPTKKNTELMLSCLKIVVESDNHDDEIIKKV